MGLRRLWRRNRDGATVERIRSALPSSEALKRVRHRWHRVLVLTTLVGVLVGLTIAAFEAVVGEWLLEWTLALPPVGQALAPGVGLLLAWCVLKTIGRGATPSSADDYLLAYHEREGDMPVAPVPGKTMGAVSTLGLGGSLGFEGPSIFLGATIGSAVRRRFPRYFEATDRRLLLVAGAAAGVAAIFKAPATGAVFALEVPYRDDSASHTAVPAIVAAAVSYLTFVIFFGLERLFPIVGGAPPLDATDLVAALVMGILAGIGARMFAIVLRKAKTAIVDVSAWVRLPAVGVGLALVAGVTALVYDRPLSLGPGFGAIDWTTEAPRSLGLVLLLLVIRAVATTLTLAGGGVGGVFIPLFVEGWLLGMAVEVVVNSDTMLFPVIGAAAFLGAGYRTPIAAVVFVAETTGRPGFVVPALVATAMAQLVMGGQSVTSYQLDRRLDPVQLRDQRLVTDALSTAPDQLEPNVPVVSASATVGDVRAELAKGVAPYVLVSDGESVLGVVTPAAILALERRPEAGR